MYLMCNFSYSSGSCWSQGGGRGVDPCSNKRVRRWEPGELPQLLRQLKSATTPTPTPTPGLSTPAKEEVPMEEDVAVKQEREEINKTPIMIKLGGHKYQFKCGNCDIAPKATSHAMDAHIRSVHTKEALVCYICPFTTYNLDSLQRHEKQEHK